MYNRLLEYIKKKQYFVSKSIWLRENHSTFMALLKLVDDISNEVNNKIYSVGIFIDPSKSVDTIDHSQLIKKLQHYGVRRIVADWFGSYCK